jgi:hypothetical protein
MQVVFRGGAFGSDWIMRVLPSLMINHQWIENLSRLLRGGGTVKGGAQLGEVGYWGHVLESSTLSPSPSYHSICSLAATKCINLLHHKLLLPWCFASPQAHSKGAR